MKALKKYLDAIARNDFRCDLKPMRKALSFMKEPQLQYPTIHIVGTNGKGSTAAFLSNILQAAELKVGLMTSPHLIDLRERIRINGEWIAWNELDNIVGTIRSRLRNDSFLSFFEMITLAGFVYFQEKKVDIALIEAGMGGRLDATNLLRAKLAVVTPISLDHEAYLGNTLAKITAEKAAVFKPGMKVISAPQEPEVAAILQESCDKINLPLEFANADTVSLPLGLHGEHQKTNAATAILAAQELLPPAKLETILPEALSGTKWPGRLQYLQKNPTILLDGAHNPAGVATLTAYLKKNHPYEKIHFLVGVLKDKNWQEMFSPLAPLAHQFFCVAPNSTRALPASNLAAHLKQITHKPITSFEKPIPETLKNILASLSDRDLLVATGSLYMIGNILLCRRRRV